MSCGKWEKTGKTSQNGRVLYVICAEADARYKDRCDRDQYKSHGKCSLLTTKKESIRIKLI